MLANSDFVLAVGSRLRLRRRLCSSLLMLALWLPGPSLGNETWREDRSGASGDSALTGDWLATAGDARFRVTRIGQELTVRLVDVAAPFDPDAAADWHLDRNNPNPSLRAQPLKGLLLGTLEIISDTEWPVARGKLYDPRSGRRVQVRAELRAPELLELRAFIGFRLLGQTLHWVRLSAFEARIAPLLDAAR